MIAKILRLKKQKRFLYKRRQKIIAIRLNLIKKLDALEALEKEVKKKRKAEKAQKNAKLAGVKHLSFSNINLPYNLIINLLFDPEDPL